MSAGLSRGLQTCGISKSHSEFGTLNLCLRVKSQPWAVYMVVAGRVWAPGKDWLLPDSWFYISVTLLCLGCAFPQTSPRFLLVLGPGYWRLKHWECAELALWKGFTFSVPYLQFPSISNILGPSFALNFWNFCLWLFWSGGGRTCLGPPRGSLMKTMVFLLSKRTLFTIYQNSGNRYLIPKQRWWCV